MAQGVSIVMASYNGVQYLDEMVQSILRQVAPDDEIIILDDGSTDGTVQLLQTYQRDYAQLTVRRNETNLGVRSTFERLLALATKDIVFLCDQDDVWVEGRKDMMVDALNQPDCIAVLANAWVLADGQTDRMFFPADQGHPPRSIMRNFIKNDFIGCCMAFRREILAIALPFPASISMHDWWLGSCSLALGEIRYLDRPSLLYRRHGNNQSSGTRRPWRRVLTDRAGNLRALAVLWYRMWRQPRSKRSGNATLPGMD